MPAQQTADFRNGQISKLILAGKIVELMHNQVDLQAERANPATASVTRLQPSTTIGVWRQDDQSGSPLIADQTISTIL